MVVEDAQPSLEQPCRNWLQHSPAPPRTFQSLYPYWKVIGYYCVCHQRVLWMEPWNCHLPSATFSLCPTCILCFQWPCLISLKMRFSGHSSEQLWKPSKGYRWIQGREQWADGGWISKLERGGVSLCLLWRKPLRTFHFQLVAVVQHLHKRPSWGETSKMENELEWKRCKETPLWPHCWGPALLSRVRRSCRRSDLAGISLSLPGGLWVLTLGPGDELSIGENGGGSILVQLYFDIVPYF